jgi:hypothetical protein
MSPKNIPNDSSSSIFFSFEVSLFTSVGDSDGDGDVTITPESVGEADAFAVGTWEIDGDVDGDVLGTEEGVVDALSVGTKDVDGDLLLCKDLITCIVWIGGS